MPNYLATSVLFLSLQCVVCYVSATYSAGSLCEHTHVRTYIRMCQFVCCMWVMSVYTCAYIHTYVCVYT